MAVLKHLIITQNGEAPSRFMETFPKARSISVHEKQSATKDCIWFKLQPMMEVQTQVEWLKEHYPNQYFIILTSLPNLGEAIYCLKSGARAYCNLHAGPETLKQIATVVHDGGIWVGEDLMQLLVSALGNGQIASAKSSAWRDKLSDREIEVVEAIANGASNKVVARMLDITERTVKAHVTTIFNKLGVKDRLKLVLMVRG